MPDLATILAISATAALLLFAPLLSDSVPVVLSLPGMLFWLVTWLADAFFTAKNWRHVIAGRETNVVVAALVRISPRNPATVFLFHAAFCFAAAVGLQALVTHTFDPFVLSCVLAVFGGLHLDALCKNRVFAKILPR